MFNMPEVLQEDPSISNVRRLNFHLPLEQIHMELESSYFDYHNIKFHKLANNTFRSIWVTVKTKSVAVTPLRNFLDNLNPTTPGNTMLIGCHWENMIKQNAGPFEQNFHKMLLFKNIHNSWIMFWSRRNCTTTISFIQTGHENRNKYGEENSHFAFQSVTTHT